MTNINDNDKNNQIKPLEKRPERVGMDINFARAHGIFAGRSTRGHRKLCLGTEVVDGEKVTYYVSVSRWRDTELTLNGDDELAFLSVYGAWEKLGCNMNDLGLMITLTRALEWEGSNKKQRHFGGRDYKKMNISLDKLATIQLIWDRYESEKSKTTESMTILKGVKLFNRKESLKKGESYFQMSELFLNEKICQNIKDGKIKLFYLSELKSLRSETARIIYKCLEHLCGVIVLPFRREVFEFMKECQIINDVDKIDEKIELQKIKRSCKQLIGRKLTMGVISECYIEKKTAAGLTQWYFVCNVIKTTTVRINKNSGEIVYSHKVPDYEDLEQTKQTIEDDQLLEKFKNLTVEEQEKIKEHGIIISRERHNGYLKDISLTESIREYFNVESENIKTPA